MGYRYAILGAGRQGVAAAFGLAHFGEADEIRLFDRNADTAQQGAQRINQLEGRNIVTPGQLDVCDAAALAKALSGVHSTLSAVPYLYNLTITEVAIDAGSNLCDLGGHTETVREQLALADGAKERGITITPDCGMGPGINISLGVHAMSFLDEPEELFIWDGGLPQNPDPPWNYACTFHINGLTNEYDGKAWFLRNGRPTQVGTLTEVEALHFDPPLGTLEAAVTAGGLSTMPWTFEGKLKTLENKTLRYPVHWQTFEAFKRLGLFAMETMEVAGATLVPREFFHSLLEPKLSSSKIRDICVIRAKCSGKLQGKPSTCTLELVQTYDDHLGFTAMEKLTGGHLSAVAYLGA
ncbi:MAG: saccharopine dehydrogenase C-terminal domain-containing protein, partial [Nitrospinaceae bacterium]